MNSTVWISACLALCSVNSFGAACSSDASDGNRRSGSAPVDRLDAGGDSAAVVTDAGVCGGGTPHGCYVPQPQNHPLCPPHSPEQSAFYPPVAEWKGCNGIQPEKPFGGDLKASCAYQSPTGEMATCLCDTGLHWLCVYPPEGDH